MPHINALSIWKNVGYIQNYQSLSPNYTILVAPLLLPKYPDWPTIPIYPQKKYIQELAFILNLYSSTRYPAKSYLSPHHF